MRFFVACLLMLALPVAVSAETITWSDTGGDGLFNNPDNWDLNRIPSELDDVVFNGTSVEDCHLAGANILVNSLTLDTGYTGTFSCQPEITIQEDFILRSGTFETSGAALFRGSFIHTGGTADIGRILMRQQRSSVIQSVANPLVTPIFDMSTWDNINVDFDVNLSVDSSFNLSAFARTTTFRFKTGSSVVLGAGSSYLHQKATIILEDGVIIDARQALEFSTYQGKRIEEGTGTLLFDAQAMSFTDSQGIAVSSLPPGGDIFVTVIDLEENLDSEAIDTVEVTVSSPTTGDTEVLTLQEVDMTVGLFRNSTPLLTSDQAANPGDGILQFATNEDLLAVYTDAEDPNDTISRPLQVSDFVWDGGGATDSWNEPENWSTDSVPTRFDSVVFNATSNKDVLLDFGYFPMNNMTVDSTYIGTIVFDRAAAQIYGDFQQSGGAIEWGTVGQELYGDFRFSGGTATPGAFTIQGAGIQEFDVRPSGLNISGFSVFSRTPVTVNIRGNLVLDNVYGSFVASGTSADIHLFDGSLDFIGGRSDFTIINGNTVTIEPSAQVDLSDIREFRNYGTVIENPPGVMLHPAKSLGFTDADGNAVRSVPDGGEVYITLDDFDENTNGAVAETTEVTVRSATTGDEEVLVLNETDVRSSFFRNATPLMTATGAAVPGDGILQKSGDEELTVHYQDNEDPSDTLDESIIVPPLVWDGGGATENWDEAANWDPDGVPGATDDVIFNATSSKDCVLNGSPVFNNFTIDADYTGSILPEKFLRPEVRGNFTQNGGAFIDDTGWWTVRGDLQVTTGTFVMKNLAQIVTRDAVCDFGPQPVDFSTLEFSSTNNSSIDAKGTFTFAGYMEFRESVRVTLVEGSATGGPTSTSFIASGSAFKISDGTQVSLGNPNGFNNYGSLIEEGSGVMRVPAIGLGLSDANGNLISEIALGSDVFVKLIDSDENTSGSLRDTSTVTISTSNSADQEIIVVNETGTKTGTFINSTGLPMQFGTAVPGNGILELNQTDNVRARYIDNEDPTDFLEPSPIPVLTPEITVLNGVTPIASGSGPFDLGSTDAGAESLRSEFAIRNVGAADLQIADVTATGGFLIEGAPSAVTAGSSATLTVALPTTTAGDFSGTVEIHSNDFDESTFTFTVTATITAPAIQVSQGGTPLANDAGPIDLGQANYLGTPLSATLLIESIGNSDLIIATADITNSYTISLTPMTIPTGESESFTVDLATSLPGTFEGTLQITSNDVNDSPFELTFTAQVLDAEIAARYQGNALESGVSLVDLGSHFVGATPVEAELLIENTGDAPLVISNASVPSGFTLTQLPVDPIAPSHSQTLRFQLETQNAATLSGDLTFSTNDYNRPEFSISLSAEVLQRPAQESIAASLLMGENELAGNDINGDGVLDVADIVKTRNP
ncbi:choice-of-anchor D domain-containing protein [bacterium]|nr:choice-of-anchor D domain-containing protein [bacterium]